jgi:hypothetical protein
MKKNDTKRRMTKLITFYDRKKGSVKRAEKMLNSIY